MIWICIAVYAKRRGSNDVKRTTIVVSESVKHLECHWDAQVMQMKKEAANTEVKHKRMNQQQWQNVDWTKRLTKWLNDNIVYAWVHIHTHTHMYLNAWICMHKSNYTYTHIFTRSYIYVSLYSGRHTEITVCIPCFDEEKKSEFAQVNKMSCDSGKTTAHTHMQGFVFFYLLHSVTFIRIPWGIGCNNKVITNSPPSLYRETVI